LEASVFPTSRYQKKVKTAINEEEKGPATLRVEDAEQNLYMSCITEESAEGSDFKLKDRVNQIVSDFIELPLEELTQTESSVVSPPLSERTEPPYTPTTFTLWRRVALKRLRLNMKE
jgi:hypothetical protein